MRALCIAALLGAACAAELGDAAAQHGSGETVLERNLPEPNPSPSTSDSDAVGVSRLAFGSCSKQYEPQPLWAHIGARGPQLFAWLGDIVYADLPVFLKVRIPATPAVLARTYAEAAEHPAYRDFVDGIRRTRKGLQQKQQQLEEEGKPATGLEAGGAPMPSSPFPPPIVGVYDDHDCGVNDATKKSLPLELKAAAREELLKFVGEPAGSPRWTLPEHGVWAQYTFPIGGGGGGGGGGLGNGNGDGKGAQMGQRKGQRQQGKRQRTARLILLDTRSQRDDFDDPAGAQDILGPAQWEWLEGVLSGSAFPHEPRPDVTIIGSGIQVLGSGGGRMSESWNRLPQSQARILSLLAVHSVTGALFISGDVHFAEINALDCDCVGYPVHDFTSSGLTHAWDGPVKRALVGTVFAGTTRVGGGKTAGRPYRNVSSSSSEAEGGPPAPEIVAPWFNEVNWGEIEFEESNVDASVMEEEDMSVVMRVFGVHKKEEEEQGKGAGKAASSSTAASRTGDVGRGVMGLYNALFREFSRTISTAKTAAAAGPGAGSGSGGGGTSEEQQRRELEARWGGRDEGASKLEPFIAIEEPLRLSRMRRLPGRRALIAEPGESDEAASARALANARACIADGFSGWGLSPACAAVLKGCGPKPTWLDRTHTAVGGAVLRSLVLFVLASILFVPSWAAFGPMPALVLEAVCGREEASKRPRWCCRGRGGDGERVRAREAEVSAFELVMPWRWRWADPTPSARVAAFSLVGLGGAGVFALLQTVH